MKDVAIQKKTKNPPIEREVLTRNGPVKLVQRIYKNGDVSLYLDFMRNGQRVYEFLNDFKLRKAKNPIEKQANADKLAKAKKLAIKRADEIMSDRYGLVNSDGRNTVMNEWMQNFIDKYTKNDKRNLQGALNRFKDYLAANKINSRLTFGQFTNDHVKGYIEHLKAKSRGEGAASYYARFKKMMKSAKSKNFFIGDPFHDLTLKFAEAENRDVLSMEEIKTLHHTPCNSEAVRRAAIFSCMTGFAWTDVKNLTWDMIDIKHWTVRKPRQKTGTSVFINLNATAKEMIGEPGKAKEPVFYLPTANGCNKNLKAWVERAGISKKITFHNLRHSFGTNLAHNGTPVIEIKELMGHKMLKYTERYVKASKEIMQRATDNLNLQ
jgi:integrase/recombinase XerD